MAAPSPANVLFWEPPASFSTNTTSITLSLFASSIARKSYVAVNRREDRTGGLTFTYKTSRDDAVRF